jgi:hypothetical protein
LPPGYAQRAICTSSCYTPSERLLFSSGYIPIKEALELRSTARASAGVVTLKGGSTTNNLHFEVHPVEAYTKSVTATIHAVMTFKMASGGSLTVTDNHPLVTGEGLLKEANNIEVGESLIRVDGSLDRVTTIERGKYKGKVYNLRPKTTEKIGNIIIAEGYLSGSSWYQNEGYDEMNKIIFRSSINIDDFVE